MPNERLLQTPAPSDRPSFTVLIDGEEIPPTVQVAALTVVKQANRVSSAQLVLLDGDPAAGTFAVSDGALFVPGRAVQVNGGYHGEEETLFTGVITGHGIKARPGKPSLLTIDCRHAAFRMTLYRRSATFLEQLDSDVFDRILGNHGISGDVAATAVTHPRLVQFDCSDWDFLLSRAEANGRLVLTNDAGVVIAAPDFAGEPVQTLTYGATLLEFEAQMDARSQLAGVSSAAWDYAGQELLTGDGAAESVVAPGNLGFDELAGVAEQDPPELRHSGLLPEPELQAWADARLQKARLAKVRGRARCTGINLQPGQLVELQGVGERFNGRVFVSGVRHEFSRGPWTTDLQLGMEDDWFAARRDIHSLPAAGLLPAVNGLQIGLVTSLEDPAGEDRVRVRLPVIVGDADGAWARVASLDAGEQRGTFWRPELGDEVVVGFLNSDPREAILLGMLHSSAKPAPLTGSDENHEKGIVTRSGMKMIWNDDKVSLTIETPAGKKLVIDEDAGSILVGDENGNTLTIDSGGFAVESPADIRIKATGDLTLEGTNVTLKASAQFKSEGSGGLELKSAGVAKLQGSLVQIN